METISPRMSEGAVIVTRANAADRDAWDAYLNARSRIPPFALFGWSEVLKACYPAQPALFAAKDASGRYSGVFFTYVRETHDRVLYSPPFGLVADNTATIGMLLDAAHDFAAHEGITRTILSSGTQSAETPYHGWTKTTLVKTLSGREEDVLQSLGRSTRYNIRRCARSGVQVRQGFEYLSGFYAAYEARMSEKCLPFHSLSFFERMAETLKDRAQLYAAVKDGKVLGGIIFLLSADVAVSLFTASFSDAMPLGVNYLLNWEAMRDFIRRGITRLDHGESRPGGGVYEFKTQLGGEPKDVFYYDAMRRAGEPAAPGAVLPLGYRLGNRIVPLLPARWRRPFLHANRRLERLL
jgi:hypothetical protein